MNYKIRMIEAVIGDKTCFVWHPPALLATPAIQTSFVSREIQLILSD